MGIFTKEEKIHFERDEEGKVIRTTSNGREYQPESPKLKSSKQLEKEYYKEHPKKQSGVRSVKAGKRAGGWIDRNLQPVGGYPPGRSPKVRRKPQKIEFGLGFGSPAKTKTPSKKKYIIRGGKAYPIAGSSKKKKSKRDFDPFDKWRL